MKMFKITLMAFTFLAASGLAAEEGMFTFDNVPTKAIEKAYGFTPSKAWLEHVQMSSVRLGNGCSGSFVSKDGLVMTNHHCVRGCIQQLSTARKDYIKDGFVVRSLKDEKVCPALEVNRLLKITDVTKVVKEATKGLSGKAYNDKLNEVTAKIENECLKGDAQFRCDVVNLYHGGLYHLYRYQRYQDVRLAFAPEAQMGHFGGDPDNFNFPRYSFDASFLRVYDKGEPLKNEHYFKWSEDGAKNGELTFITGHPGRTSRLLTLAQLDYQRDYFLVDYLIRLSEMRGLLLEYQKKGKEQHRTAHSLLQGVENSFKALRGKHKALIDPEFYAKLKKQETEFRRRVDKNSKLKKEYSSAWSEIASAVEVGKSMSQEVRNIAFADFGSKLFTTARHLVRLADEQNKSLADRLPEYADSRLPQLKQSVMSSEPIYDELEIALIEFNLLKLREALSPDHHFVKLVLGKETPRQVAERLVKKTRLQSVKEREKLYANAEAVSKSKDEMILFAKAIDEVSRKIRKDYEDKVESVVKKASEKIAAAQFAIYGTEIYPDATFTLRLSYGRVKGYQEPDRKIGPYTFVRGLYERATGAEPFDLPKSWIKAEKTLTADTPFNFATTNDIIGGNSGSPVINQNAEIVGLVFDGNIHSLGGDYGFDESLNRAVSVHSSIIKEALAKVYNLDLLPKSE